MTGVPTTDKTPEENLSDQPSFVDQYEVLQLSPSADTETVERVYRLLAKRYHPDNSTTGDEARFREIHAAYEVLSNPEKRAAFDVAYDREKERSWELFDPGMALDTPKMDARISRGVLNLLYIARRRDPKSGGMGPVHMEQILGVPREHLDFPIWYLRKRGLIETLPSGELAITVDGVDKVAEEDAAGTDGRLLLGSDRTDAEDSEPAAVAI